MYTAATGARGLTQLGRAARVAAAMFGDVPLRGVMGLGAYDAAAWAAYQSRIAHGDSSGPPGGTLEDPNGGVLHFDANGQSDYYSPPAKPLTDTTVQQDTFSTFYGWTAYEQDALEAAQITGPTGITTDYLRARAIYPPGSNTPTYTAADIAESDRQLRAFAASSPKIQAALKTLAGGAFHGAQADADAAAEAARIAAGIKATEDRVDAMLKALVTGGEYFTDTIPPGGYSDSTLRGMLSTSQWRADALSVANGGKPVNALAAAGRLPSPLPPGVFVVGSSATPAPDTHSSVMLPNDRPPVDDGSGSSGGTSSSSSSSSGGSSPFDYAAPVTSAPTSLTLPNQIDVTGTNVGTAASSDLMGTLTALAKNPLTWAVVGGAALFLRRGSRRRRR